MSQARKLRLLCALTFCCSLLLAASDPQVSRVLGLGGDGKHRAIAPRALTTDAAGNLYAACFSSNNVFRVAPDGKVTRLIGGSGDGQGNGFHKPRDLAVDAGGTVYAVAEGSHNAFAIAPNGDVRLLIGRKGDGEHPLRRPTDVVADARGNVYVAGQSTHNVFRIGPDGKKQQIIDRAGDGKNEMNRPNGLAVTPEGVLYVVAATSANVFRVSPDGEIRQVLDKHGAGKGKTLMFPNSAALDAAGNLYVGGNNSGNVLRVTPDGKISQVTGARIGERELAAVTDVDVAKDGTVFLSRMGHDAVWRVSEKGGLELLLQEGRHGRGAPVRGIRGLTLDAEGNVYVSGMRSHTVLKVVPPPPGQVKPKAAPVEAEAPEAAEAE